MIISKHFRNKYKRKCRWSYSKSDTLIFYSGMSLFPKDRPLIGMKKASTTLK